MKRYTAKELTKYAEKIGFNEPKVWYSRMDGWWLETDKTEEYLGVWSSEAKSKLTELCEGVFFLKETRGGTRQGSGAKPKYSEQTKTVAFRCPLSKVDELKIIVKSKLSEWSVK